VRSIELSFEAFLVLPPRIFFFFPFFFVPMERGSRKEVLTALANSGTLSTRASVFSPVVGARGITGQKRANFFLRVFFSSVVPTRRFGQR